MVVCEWYFLQASEMKFDPDFEYNTSYKEHIKKNRTSQVTSTSSTLLSMFIMSFGYLPGLMLQLWTVWNEM